LEEEMVTRESSHIHLLTAVILTVLVGSVAAMQTAPQSDCNCNGAKTVSPEDKLINCRQILVPFEQGQEKVKVIVNLTRPEQILKTTDWWSKNSLERLHGEVINRQNRTLATLVQGKFKLRYKFENQAAFSAEVTQDCLNQLIGDANVVSIEPVYILEKHLAQGIPLINGSIYRSTYNGQGVAIAICDTGIDYTHSMLGGGGFPNSKVIGGYDFGDSDSNPFPSEAHGTCCAGIAAGNLGSVGDYIGGVAYGAKLYALKVEDSSGYIYTDSIVAAWDWCVSHKNDNPAYPILVISTSLGSGRYYSACDSSNSSLATAANDAVAAGITLLVSAGNDGYCDSIASPACLSNVISVGAVYDAAFGTYQPCVNAASCATKYSTTGCSTGWYSIDTTAPDKVTSYSNTASFLGILAPSNQAYTTDIAGSSGYSTGDYYSSFGGTSAASPYAAGAVACLQSAAKVITGNYLTPAQVKSILISTGNNVTDTKVSITKPRINLGNAIESLEPNSNPCTDITIGTGTSSWNYPMHTKNDDSRTQVIYLASEIGTSGIIKSLALNVTAIPGQIMYNWTIRMKHTALSAYSSCSLDSTGWTTVYQANEPRGSTGWRTFTFATPFVYNGTSNLLIDFSHNNTSRTSSNGACRYSTPGGSRSVYAFSNSANGDPLNWTGTTSPTTSCDTRIPNIRLTVCQPQEPNAPFLHVEPDITPGLCNTIFWDAVTDANQYYAECSADSNFSIIDSNSGWIADANYQFCQLVSGQTYFYRVKAKNQYLLESGWSNVVSSRQCSIPGDFEPDCDVDWIDLMMIAEQWLQSPAVPSADIAPPPSGDGIVNFLDFAELAKHWLQGVQ
jgi:subtilisin family serine protease